MASVFKPGDTDEVNNKSPMTMLLILSKVCQKIVADQLTTDIAQTFAFLPIRFRILKPEKIKNFAARVALGNDNRYAHI